MKYRISTILLILTTNLFAQFVTVNDANFAQALCNNYPEIMNVSCSQLDTVKADKIDFTLDLSNANITNASEIIYFNRIDSLILKGNNLSAFVNQIQPANYWSLHYIDLSDNQLSKFPTLSINVNFVIMTDIFFQNNKATTLQKFWGIRDSLINLNVSNNYLTSCEDYSMALKAKSINLSNNYFTFEDLLPHTKHPQFNTVFTVSPQRKIQWSTSIVDGKELESFKLTIPVDSFVTNNTYNWYKDGQFLRSTTSNTLTFDTLTLLDAGSYTVTITNSNTLMSNVTLNSEAIQVFVQPCMHLSESLPIIISEKCKGAKLTVSSSPSNDGIAPYTFVVSSQNDYYSFNSTTNVELPVGTFDLTIIDKNNCSKTYPSQIIVKGTSDCDTHVITPDGDGLQDEYYFDINGEAKIYNLKGQLINTLELPGFWNARNISGEIVPPGKYIMVINESEKIELKIIW